MGYRVLGKTADLFQGFEQRRGLEGPYIYSNGRVLYYDPRAGQYWDPKTDFYVAHSEVHDLQNDLIKAMAR